MGEMSPELLQILSDRAHTPDRRTYMSGTEAQARPVDIGELLADLRKHGAPGAQPLGDMFERLSGLFGDFGGVLAMGPDGPIRFGAPAAPPPSMKPASAAQIAAAEGLIGRALPEDLKQLYRIADGGFGPGGGLFPLNRLSAHYRQITGEPFGPAGQPWPAQLLPIFDEDGVPICLDLDSGAVIAWEAERIEDEESEDDWLASFVPEADSLADLMRDWSGRPTFAEQFGNRG